MGLPPCKRSFLFLFRNNAHIPRLVVLRPLTNHLLPLFSIALNASRPDLFPLHPPLYQPLFCLLLPQLPWFLTPQLHLCPQSPNCSCFSFFRTNKQPHMLHFLQHLISTHYLQFQPPALLRLLLLSLLLQQGTDMCLWMSSVPTTRSPRLTVAVYKK